MDDIHYMCRYKCSCSIHIFYFDYMTIVDVVLIIESIFHLIHWYCYHYIIWVQSVCVCVSCIKSNTLWCQSHSMISEVSNGISPNYVMKIHTQKKQTKQKTYEVVSFGNLKFSYGLYILCGLSKSTSKILSKYLTHSLEDATLIHCWKS